MDEEQKKENAKKVKVEIGFLNDPGGSLRMIRIQLKCFDPEVRNMYRPDQFNDSLGVGVKILDKRILEIQKDYERVLAGLHVMEPLYPPENKEFIRKKIEVVRGAVEQLKKIAEWWDKIKKDLQALPTKIFT